MDKYLSSRLDPKILELPIDLACICASKRIKLADKLTPEDENTFILDNRKLILDYHKLTGNFRGIVKHMLFGKAILNEEQLERYQRKDFVRVYTPYADQFSLWDDYHPSCDDPEH
jgi:hypothetical protein